MDASVIPSSLALGATAGALSSVHCAAMCGPIAVLSGAGGERAPVLRFLGGRVLGYAGAGLLVGALGHEALATLPVRAAGALVTLGLALSLAVLGVRFLRARGESPRLAPPTLTKRAAPWTSRAIARVRERPMLLGALVALLPCGVLYAALTTAALTGSALGGAIAMGAFAIASSLGLAFSGSLASFTGSLDPGTRRALGAVLVMGALVLALRPWWSPAETPACHASAGVHSAP